MEIGVFLNRGRPLARKLAFLVRPIVLALLVLGRPLVAEEELRNPYAGDVQAALEGHDLFRKAGCFPCHGPEAEGGSGPDLTDDVWRFKPTDDMLFRTIIKGRAGTRMASFRDKLLDEEVWKIIEFLRDKNRTRKSSQ